jgi:hypothetical protein
MAPKKVAIWRIKKFDTAVKGRTLINVRSPKCLWSTPPPHPPLTRRPLPRRGEVVLSYVTCFVPCGRMGGSITLLPLPFVGEVAPKGRVRGILRQFRELKLGNETSPSSFRDLGSLHEPRGRMIERLNTRNLGWLWYFSGFRVLKNPNPLFAREGFLNPGMTKRVSFERSLTREMSFLREDMGFLVKAGGEGSGNCPLPPDYCDQHLFF